MGYLYLWYIIDTARIECRAGSAKRSVSPSVSQPVHSIVRQQHRWPAGLLLSALRAADIDLQLPARRTGCRRAQQQRRRSTALRSKCGQCHVDRRGARLSTDLLYRVRIGTSTHNYDADYDVSISASFSVLFPN